MSICGRFGVALLGFAYNIDDNIVHTSQLFRPDWVNITIPCGIRAIGNREEDINGSGECIPPKLRIGVHIGFRSYYTLRKS